MSFITAIILDDSPEEADVLIKHLENILYIKHIHYFKTPQEALIYLSANQVDVLFLDMMMPEINGLDFLKIWTTSLPTIVVSSHSNFAMDCFDHHNIIDYIQKPVSFNRLIRALNRLYLSLKPEISKELLWLKVGRKIQNFKIADILYIEADGIYSKIWSADGTFTLANDNISEIEQKLQGTKLLRLHKSYIFNTLHIKSFDSKCIWILNKPFPIGVAYRSKIDFILTMNPFMK